MSRTRDFDIDQAVDQAMLLFWRKGYEGTSLTDLTDAMGINRPSLYAAFGSKEGLFQRTVERYLAGPGACVEDALKKPTARGVFEHLLQVYSDVPTKDAGRPPGCLIVQGALVCSEESSAVQTQLMDIRQAGEAATRERFRRAKAEGDLPADESPAELSRYVWTICHGLSVQAASGATRAELKKVAARALAAWPTSK